jgi:hypothetical protein
MPRSLSDILWTITERLIDAKREASRSFLYNTAVYAITSPRGELNTEYSHVRTSFEAAAQRITDRRGRVDP